MKTHYIGHDQRYQELKNAGELGWDSGGYLKFQALVRSLLEAIDLPKRAKIVELGCGAGNMSVWLAQQGFVVSGVDIAPSAIKWAKQKAKESGVLVDFRVGDVCNLTHYEDSTFEAVLDGHCLHCIIGKDRQRFLSTAFALLKPKGYLLIDTMCGDPKSATMIEHFDPKSRCTLHGDIATRYLGLADKILTEVIECGFEIITSKHEIANEGDGLIIIAQKP